MRIPMSFAAALGAGFCLASAAVAQPPAAPAGPPARITGTVAAIAADGLTIRAADGKETKVGLAPGWSLVVSKPVEKDAIKVGSFVATANLGEPDGTGRSIEIRLFEPGLKAGEGNRPMAQPGQMMTNATVTKVAKTDAGLEIDVAFPGGVRHIVVPPDVKVMASIPVDPSTLKPGAHVTAGLTRGPDGAPRAGRIQMDTAG